MDDPASFHRKHRKSSSHFCLAFLAWDLYLESSSMSLNVDLVTQWQKHCVLSLNFKSWIREKVTSTLGHEWSWFLHSMNHRAENHHILTVKSSLLSSLSLFLHNQLFQTISSKTNKRYFLMILWKFSKAKLL